MNEAIHLLQLSIDSLLGAGFAGLQGSAQVSEFKPPPRGNCSCTDTFLAV
jgi:hypothetical protein